MKTIEIHKHQTVAQYNNSVLCISDILTGKQFRRMNRKTTKS